MKEKIKGIILGFFTMIGSIYLLTMFAIFLINIFGLFSPAFSVTSSDFRWENAIGFVLIPPLFLSSLVSGMVTAVFFREDSNSWTIGLIPLFPGAMMATLWIRQITNSLFVSVYIAGASAMVFFAGYLGGYLRKKCCYKKARQKNE